MNDLQALRDQLKAAREAEAQSVMTAVEYHMIKGELALLQDGTLQAAKITAAAKTANLKQIETVKLAALPAVAPSFKFTGEAAFQYGDDVKWLLSLAGAIRYTKQAEKPAVLAVLGVENSVVESILDNAGQLPYWKDGVDHPNTVQPNIDVLLANLKLLALCVGFTTATFDKVTQEVFDAALINAEKRRAELIKSSAVTTTVRTGQTINKLEL